MSLIHAGTPEALEAFGETCTIYDRNGRLVKRVFAMNPETGEVIRWCVIPFWLQVILGTCVRITNRIVTNTGDGYVLRSHEFLPAPFRVVREAEQ